MNMRTQPTRNSRRATLTTALAIACSIPLTGALIVPAAYAQNTQHYTQTNLTSNLGSLAPTVDANLVNPWGLSRSSKGPWWASDNGPGLSTLYDGTGKIVPLVVPIPPADTTSPTGTPTGTVFNGDPTAFQIAPGKNAVFLFVTEDGTISGWNPGVSPKAVIVVNKTKNKAVYKGATIATVEKSGVTQSYLYVADFRHGKVKIFDSTFKPAELVAEREEEEDESASFVDERLPRGYAPFNVQNIGGDIYVTYAKQDSTRLNEVDGAGLGYVDVYTASGTLLHRLQSGSWFNAPWGLALGSSDFGAYSHDVLVGQFGSGEILAFDPLTGRYKGKLQTAANQPIRIDGLWALAFGNDGTAGPATSLYFTAGPNHEQNGLFGNIVAIENVQGNDQ